MKGSDVYGALQNIGAKHLHHANSVMSSRTYLEQGGLLSREYVEKHGLSQTPQPTSDEIDKKFGIWNRVFVDHVDIHGRGGRKKGPNQYGPVLFVLDLEILLHLPAGTDILVTKKNPIHWRDNESDSDHWYQTAQELAANIEYGNFDKMLVIQTPSGGKVDFLNRQARIMLDDPQRGVSTGEDAYAYAEVQLNAAAQLGHVEVSIARHDCRPDCICIEKYKRYAPQKVDFYFK